MCTVAGLAFVEGSWSKKVCRPAPGQFSQTIAEIADWSALAWGPSPWVHWLRPELSGFFIQPIGLDEKKTSSVYKTLEYMYSRIYLRSVLMCSAHVHSHALSLKDSVNSHPASPGLLLHTSRNEMVTAKRPQGYQCLYIVNPFRYTYKTSAVREIVLIFMHMCINVYMFSGMGA